MTVVTELEAVPYTHAGVALTGLLARPAGAARAAVALFPTIANANPLMKQRAQRLADAGYLVLIVDFYGEPVESFQASFPLAEKLRADNDYYRARIAAGIDALRSHPDAAGLTVFAIGHCMGGQAVLEAARDGQDLAGVVSFHGTLGTSAPAQAGTVRPRILICHGDADPLAPREQVLAFWDEMDAAGADWHFHAYAGVRHGFTDPDSDTKGMAALNYNASADRQSWAAMLSFFDEILGD